MIVSAFPVKVKLLARSNRPVKVVSVVPSSCVKLSAVTVSSKSTVLALVTTMSPVPKPTTPVTVTFPSLPALKVIDSPAVLASVCESTMSSPAPPPLVKTMTSFAVPVSVTPVANEIPSAWLVMSSPITLTPVPFCTNSRPTSSTESLDVVNVPRRFVTVIDPSASFVPTPLIVSAFPVKVKFVTRSNRPPKVVVPVPAA